MTVNNDSFMRRIERVDNKIRAYARFLAFNAPHVTSDDLYQQSMLKMFERYCVEPEFLQQNDSYLAFFASWVMKVFLNRERNMFALRVTDLESPEVEEQYSYPAGHFPRPESQAVRAEVMAIAEQMPEHYRVIFDATAQGYNEQEVADMLDIKKPILHYRKQRMIETLSEAWKTPVEDRDPIIRRMYGWPSHCCSSLVPNSD